jgi:histidine decarboxylase
MNNASSSGVDQTAISPYQQYCDGYSRPGATGLGYVSVLKVITGVVDENALDTSDQFDFLIDGIVAYDRAEANGAYIGQINMETASSFCGIAGQVWGYDIAVADEIAGGGMQPLFTTTQYDGSTLPVYDAQPLIDAGVALFGTESARIFPPAPGAHVICANKSVTALYPESGELNLADGNAYGVWAYIAISITRDRSNSADLFIEDAGLWTQDTNVDNLVTYLNSHREQVVWSITACGEDQSVLYDATYISYAYCMMQPGQVGTALTVAPYVTLARGAVPTGGFNTLNDMTLSTWQADIGLSADLNAEEANPPENNYLGAPPEGGIDPNCRASRGDFRRRGRR